METNDAANNSHAWKAFGKAQIARKAYRENPNIGTFTGARLKTLDFYRMCAKRRAARGRPDLRGAARKASEAKRRAAFDAASARRDSHYNNNHAR